MRRCVGSILLVILVQGCASSPAKQTKPALLATRISSLGCPEGMLLIPGARVEIGDESHWERRPSHEVTLQDFCLDKTEVTVEAYGRCVAQQACKEPGGEVAWPDVTRLQTTVLSQACNWGREGRAEHPINCVTWKEANAYCQWLGKRLPWEQEWEYAAKGNDERSFPWGNEGPSPGMVNGCDASCYAWARRLGFPKWGALYSQTDGWETTSPVGSFPQGDSPFGIADMGGNVAEWTASGYSDNYAGLRYTGWRTVRGGSWYFYDVEDFEVTNRQRFTASGRFSWVGFRCAR